MPILQVAAWIGARTVFLNICATVMYAGVSPGTICGEAGISDKACGNADSTIAVKMPHMTGVSPPDMGEAASEPAASLAAAKRVAGTCWIPLWLPRHMHCPPSKVDAGTIVPSLSAFGLSETGAVTLRPLRTPRATAPPHD